MSNCVQSRSRAVPAATTMAMAMAMAGWQRGSVRLVTLCGSGSLGSAQRCETLGSQSECVGVWIAADPKSCFVGNLIDFLGGVSPSMSLPDGAGAGRLVSERQRLISRRAQESRCSMKLSRQEREPQCEFFDDLTEKALHASE